MASPQWAMAHWRSAVYAALKCSCARSYMNECSANIPSLKCFLHAALPVTGKCTVPIWVAKKKEKKAAPSDMGASVSIHVAERELEAERLLPRSDLTIQRVVAVLD